MLSLKHTAHFSSLLLLVHLLSHSAPQWKNWSKFVIGERARVGDVGEGHIQRGPFLLAHLPTLTYYSVLICHSEWPFSYSGNSRQKNSSAIPRCSVNCEYEQRIQRCSHPCISSWGCPRWRPHWSCWAAPCHPPRCVWHYGSASGTGAAPGSPAKKTHTMCTC